ncbi:MAG TPA: TonB-dependent receptor, partial [Blastocatellia bacterium]|nr:TonB-dependent receptor [Blastocatellia bacterium]
MKRVLYACLIGAIIILARAPLSAQSPSPTPDLTTVSLEELMRIKVISASKKEENLFQTAAAIYVITEEEIRRSGLTNLPELLRLAPGLQVARIDGTKWAISARGFNGRFANKLLVLIDGRSIYSSETSGVYWEEQDLPLENIERIEVIRGPGGTLWGANAVNGVINIITKQAQETQGGWITAGGGSEESGFGFVQYGGKISDRNYYRAHAKYSNRNGLVDASGRHTHDWQHMLSGGWRMDWKPSEFDTLSLHGNIYDHVLRETSLVLSPVALFAPPTLTPGEFTGGNALARWRHVFSERSDMAAQVYFNRARQEIRDLGQRFDTFDFDFQHRLALGRRQDLLYGLGYRLIVDQTSSNSGTPVQYIPKGKSIQVFSGFVQDALTLVKDRLRLTIGSKLERHDYTGFELQPSARLLWTPNAHQTVWAASSRAVRTPARYDQDLRSNFRAISGEDGTPIEIIAFGDSRTKSEELRAYEFGYRVRPDKKLVLDIAAFYNLYDRLTTIEPDQPFFQSDPPPLRLVTPYRFSNQARGESYGLEATANLWLTRRWRLQGNYS